MVRGIDQPYERPVEPVVDVLQRYKQAIEEERQAANELASIEADDQDKSISLVVARENLRIAENVRQFWETRAAYFNLDIEARAFHIVAVLALEAMRADSDAKNNA